MWLEHRVLTALRSRFLLDAAIAFADDRETWLATRYMDGGDLSRYLCNRRGLGGAAGVKWRAGCPRLPPPLPSMVTPPDAAPLATLGSGPRNAAP